MAHASRSHTPTPVTEPTPVLSTPETAFRRQPPFLMWYDDNPKTPVVRKITEAIEAYKARFPGVQPTLVLVNEAEVTTIEGITVRAMPTVNRNTYWVGQIV
ncbi:hypothetical protein [Chloroflexus sp.]|uniref:hypothetical protein n=1 Tax=Chloroflexus sp. TaxID=1904827 RepID=UPI002ADD32D3|nr:hypothetical protein [Chloroflexus sp.]